LSDKPAVFAISGRNLWTFVEPSTLIRPSTERSLQTNRGIVLADATPIADVHGHIDTLVIAGGPGAESGAYDANFLAWITQAARLSRRVASICTGAFLLAEAGLLNGKRAVTHWRFCDRLAREYPEVVVRPEPIYLRDGSIYTSAGITAGIDLSLALVEEDHGHETALEIARFLVMFLVSLGGQAQYSHMLSHQAITSQSLRELQVWMLQHLRESLTVESLAARMAMSARHFTRGLSPRDGNEPRPVCGPDARRSGPADHRQLLSRAQRDCRRLRLQVGRCDAPHFSAGAWCDCGRIR
jgi:transcriptional regulator GlxA family with amidase domain